MRPDGEVPVDFHVHLYPCYEFGAFLAAAARNFQRLCGQRTPCRPYRGILMLTETSRDHAYRRLSDLDGRVVSGRWTAHVMPDRISVTLDHGGEAPLVLVAGRQTQTREGLEVLSLGVDAEFRDGSPTEALIEDTISRRGLPVVPWGFGKWWFGRGRFVDRLLRTDLAASVFLGDNGGRWRRLPQPSLLRLADERGIPVLPGSDPLPFPGHVRRIASYGAMVPGRPDARGPGEWIVRTVRDSRTRLHRFGDLTGLGSFVRDQLAMQLRKRRPRSTP